MAAQAQIKINGVAGSNDDLPYEDVVNLSNNNLGDEITYAWTIIAKPAGSTATLSDPNDPAPTFTADAEGTYLIRLVVNEGAPSEDTDQVVAAVRELQTNNRIPAAGETTENNSNSASTGWAYEAVDQILQRVTRMEDEGFITAVAAGVLTPGAIVKITDSVPVGAGTNVRNLPKIAAANATDWGSVNGVLGYLMGAAQGGPIAAGTVCRVMLHGLLPVVSIAKTFSFGAPVYINNLGAFDNVPGDNPRVVGTIAKIIVNNISFSVYFSGYQSQQPYGSAGGDLTDLYPDPIVAKINGTTVTTPGGGLATNRVLMTTSTNAADWKQINLSTTSTFTGKLYPTQGGTGSTDNAIQGGVMYGYNTSEYKPTAAGTTGQFLRSNGLGAPGWYAVDLGNSTSVTGKLDFVNGGTNSNFDPGVANKGGVVYFNNTTQRYQPNTSGTTSQVLVGGDEPTWGTVPTGAFAGNSIPWSAINDKIEIFYSSAYSNNTSVYTTVCTKTATFSNGLLRITLAPKDGEPEFDAYLTTAGNNQSATAFLQYQITGPDSFSETYLYKVRSAVSHNTNQITGSVFFPVITVLLPAPGSYTATLSAKVGTAGDSITINCYQMNLTQG